jgi:hypothetical protein
MQLNCNHCGSENIQRISVIHEGGTSRGKSFSAGGFGGNAGAVSTVTSSQTNLAAKLSPPPKMGIITTIFLGIGILLTASIAVAMLPERESWWIFWLFLAALQTFKLVRGLNHNKRYPEAIAKYRKTWHCHKCGELSEI